MVWGLFQIVLVLALYDRLRERAPVLSQTATAVGLVWAALVIAAGLIATLGITTAVELYGTDPAQAGSFWAAIETVAAGRTLEHAVFIYGIGFIVWWVWLGAVMLRNNAPTSS